MMPPSLASLADAAHTLLEWLQGSPSNGDAFLSALFALNASFASLDSLTAGVTKSLRSEISKLTAKYTREWVEGVKKDIPGDDIDGKERIGTLVGEVLQLDGKISNLFSTMAWGWKSVMGVCAAVLLVSLACPYYCRIFLLLALPAPLFVVHCRIKAWVFCKKARRKCEEIERGVDELKAKAKRRSAPESGEALALIDERLGRLEERVEKLLSALGAK